jgi:acyl-CoA synthetase (AMP-forming)/AMP-acid ligase II
MTLSHTITQTLSRYGQDQDSPFATAQIDIHGVQHQVFSNAPKNLREMFTTCMDQGDLPFLVCGDDRFSFAETYTQAAQLAHALHTDLGIKKGDRVALVMRNYPEWVMSYMALTAIGAVCVSLNAWWQSDELQYGLEHSGSSLLIADEGRLNRIQSYLGESELPFIAVRLSATSELGEMAKAYDWVELLGRHQGEAFPNVHVAPEDGATILYTSGSTGHPKGVLSSHRAVVSTIWQWLAMTCAHIEIMGDDLVPAKHQPAALLSIPLFHVTGCNTFFLLSMMIGRKVVMMHKWDVEVAMKMVEDEKITMLGGVPTMSMELLAAAESSKRDLSSLTNIQAGGAARPAEQVEQLFKMFEAASPSTGYGLTETNGLATSIAEQDYRDRPASVGIASGPMAQVKIVDDEGVEVVTGQSGEILIKSVTNFDAYWKNPEASAASFQGEWFVTGDIGSLDEEGFLYILDRKKDIVIRGGENISCLEIELAIYDYPKVQEVGVFSAPDERLGECVVAAVMPREGEEVTKAEILDFLRKRLAAFKIPSDIWLHRENLPRIASGKIAKVQLKQDYIALAK